MQKIKMSRGVTLTFEDGCKRYLENCRQRNLRDGTKALLQEIITQKRKFMQSKLANHNYNH